MILITSRRFAFFLGFPVSKGVSEAKKNEPGQIRTGDLLSVNETSYR